MQVKVTFIETTKLPQLEKIHTKRTVTLEDVPADSRYAAVQFAMEWCEFKGYRFIDCKVI